jgi:hypothetical protein
MFSTSCCRLPLFAALLSLLFVALAPAQENGSSPEGVIREFYAWYVKAVLADRDPFTDDSAKLKQYATARFIGQIKKMRDSGEMGADPFVQAQDLDKEWAKNIKVSTPAIKGDVATANVELKGSEMGTHKLGVTMRQQSGTWKVDRVDAR